MAPGEEKKPETMTAEQIAESADRVIIPELNSIDVEFQGTTLKVMPLPISVSRQVKEAVSPVLKSMSGVIGVIDPEENPEAVMAKLMETPGALEMDEKLAGAFIRAAVILAGHYGLEVTYEEADEKFSLTEIAHLVTAQMKVSGSEDFMLRPLRLITEALSSLMGLDSELYRSLRETFPLSKLGD